ncbi:MAG TPA: hypothetical protein PKY08_00150 [Candidatus Magasanikbacteria bacterium]|nr:hypothetical protein [Candidatus Magasanikbacteria bacterium]
MPFAININWDYLEALGNFLLYAPPFRVYFFLFVHGGWFVLMLIFHDLFLDFYILNRIGSYLSKFKWIFLAIDVPKGNEQTPKAVEQIFAHLAGAHKNPDIEDAYLAGYSQPWFSFEIISIEGYTQFVIGTNKKYRDLIEAAIYAQYPDAEITEIEDYAKDFPSHFPSKEYDLWGAEYVMTGKEQVYPIRTYTEFEHSSAENVYKDPLAAMLETLSRLGKGEFAGMQILIKPIDNEWSPLGSNWEGGWKAHGKEVVKKMTGAPPKKAKAGLIAEIGSLPAKAMDTAAQSVFTDYQGFGQEEKKKDEAPSLMLHLPPGYKADIEKVEQKISKICYATKIRFIYLAKKESFSKNRIAYGFTGSIKQFNTENLNGLKPEMHKIGTHVHYLFKDERLAWRQTRLVNAYKARSRWKGASEFLMNIEELASIWHFPLLTVKAPMVATAEAKKGQPPASLPTERAGGLIRAIERKSIPPPNLPM